MKKFTSPFIFIKRSLDLFFKKENLLFFIQVYLPVGFLAVLMTLFALVPSLNQIFNPATGNSQVVVFPLIDKYVGSSIAVLVTVLTVLVNVFVNLAGILAIKKVVSGEKLNVRATYKETFSKYRTFLALSVVVWLIHTAGLILLLFPFVIVTTWFIFSKFIIVEKRLGVKMSLVESKRLVKGDFWKILLRMVVFYIFFYLTQLLLVSFPYGVGYVTHSLFGALFLLPYFLFYKEVSSAKTIDL